jgi:predicted DNA-binding transcriptional regulator AlpA
MTDLMTIDDISTALNLSHAYTRDRLVKRPDFPRPAVALSQKCRRWNRDDFNAWLHKHTKKQAR